LDVVALPFVDSLATWRLSDLFSLISLATIEFNRVTSSPP
jgi:hypothetical protein